MTAMANASHPPAATSAAIRILSSVWVQKPPEKRKTPFLRADCPLLLAAAAMRATSQTVLAAEKRASAISTRSLQSVTKSRPTAAAAMGTRLISVNPGIVFTSST